MLVRALLATLAGALASSALAIGLGDMVLRSGLGEAMRAEVAVTAAGGEEVAASCFRLATQPADGHDELPRLLNARFSVEAAPGGARLQIVSPQVINDPVLVVGVRYACGFALTRDYTLLLSPPEIPVALPTAAAAAPARQAAPRAAAGAEWEAAAGDTLGSIAAQLYPQLTRMQRRFVVAAARANPGMFSASADAASAPIPAGTRLVVPDARTVAATSVELRRPQAEQAAAARQAPRARARAERRAPAPPPETPPQDRLTISGNAGEGESLRLSTVLSIGARGQKMTEEQRELLRTEQRLLQALEEKIVQELALTERIRQMESTLAEVQSSLAQLEGRKQALEAPRPEAAPAPAPAPAPAAAAAPRAAAAPPPAPSSSGSDWADWLLFGGLAAVVALLVGLLLFLRRRSSRAYEQESFDEPELAAEPASVTAAPDEEFLAAVRQAQPALEAAAASTPIHEIDTLPPDITTHEHTIDLAEHESAMELAEIMLSFGRVQGAAQALADYIEANPRQTVAPWLKLLDVYRSAGMRSEWEILAKRLHETFNVESLRWDGDGHSTSSETLEGYAHIVTRLTGLWNKPECVDYLRQLLSDNRDGARVGFPLPVLDEIMFLIALIEQERGARKPGLELEARARESVG